MADGALPMRVRIGVCRTAKRVTLGKATGFGVAAFQFFNLRQQQAQAALMNPFGLSGFDMMAGFTG